MNNLAMIEATVSGKGKMSLPDNPVPSVQSADYARDPQQDYVRSDPVLAAWIRRAVHSERFAKALEAELETHRSQSCH